MAVVQRLSPPWDRLEMIPDRCERGKIPPVRVGTDGLYQGLTVRSSRRRGRRAALESLQPLEILPGVGVTGAEAQRLLEMLPRSIQVPHLHESRRQIVVRLGVMRILLQADLVVHDGLREALLCLQEQGETNVRRCIVRPERQSSGVEVLRLVEAPAQKKQVGEQAVRLQARRVRPQRVV